MSDTTVMTKYGVVHLGQWVEVSATLVDSVAGGRTPTGPSLRGVLVGCDEDVVLVAASVTDGPRPANLADMRPLGAADVPAGSAALIEGVLCQAYGKPEDVEEPDDEDGKTWVGVDGRILFDANVIESRVLSVGEILEP